MLARMFNHPSFLKFMFNMYRPYRGAGIKIQSIAKDFSSAKVCMPLTRGNKNYVGVHFGGSLYAMVDPFYMLLAMHQLGKDYVVWDQAAHIQFIKPGKGTVYAHFELSPAQIADMKQNTAKGEKYLPEFTLDITDEQGQVVAKVSKTLYVRRKRAAR